MAHLSIGVLGGLRVSTAGAVAASFESDKVRALFAYLVVEADHPHPRETLAGLFWPECSEQTARHNLSQALFNLRQVLGDPTAVPAYLHITRATIQFNPKSDYMLDLDQFNTRFSVWEKSRGQGTVGIPQLEDLAGLYCGEFLQAFYLKDSPEFEEWILVQRAAVHLRAMTVLATLADAYEKRGDFQAAQSCCLKELTFDPWREEVHRHLMRLLGRMGQRSAALAQYETCKKLLADELGVEPTPQTRELYEQIRLGTFQPNDKPSTSTTGPSHPKLRLPLTPFLGREKELAALGQLIARPDCRCISLIGPGGIGKTRLALEAAERNQHGFAHGAAFIPLVSTASAEAVVSAIASGIGLAFYGPLDPKMQLLNHLMNQSILLILDNVEHLLAAGSHPDAITDIIIEILQQTPQVKLLITSREALNIGGEWTYEVRGLDYPEPETIDNPDEFSSMALFIQHARRIRPGYAVDEGNKRSIARLCRLVEGMPLAIELAAAWVRLLSPEEIAAEVERSLDFLNTQMRDIPERHRSMRAVFDPSWQMLSLEEKHVISKLSIFRGGFGRQAAEQVAGASLLVLSSLVIRSLVRRTKAGRYDIHELIRQYAASKLAEQPMDLQTVQERHSLYYLTLLEENDARLHSPEQKAALTELTEEIHNIHAAWDWAVKHQKVNALYRAGTAMRQLFELRNWFKEGELVFEQTAEAIQANRDFTPEAVDPQIARAVMLAHSGFFMFRQGKSAAAYATLNLSLERLRAAALEAGDPHLLVYSLVYLGIVCWELGRFSEAVERLQEGLQFTQRYQLGWQAAHLIEFLGIVAYDRGEYVQARQYLCRALDLFRQYGDQIFTAHTLSYLGRVQMAVGDYSQAEGSLQESLKIARDMDYMFGAGLALDAAGQLAYIQGNYPEAQGRFSESANLFRTMGDSHRLARTLTHQGMTALARNQTDEAQQSFTAALRLALNGGLIPAVLASLAGLAALQARRGANQKTLETVLFLLQHPAANQETKDIAQGLLNALEPKLSGDVIETAHQSTAAIDLKSVVDELRAGSPDPFVLDR